MAEKKSSFYRKVGVGLGIAIVVIIFIIIAVNAQSSIPSTPTLITTPTPVWNYPPGAA